MTDAARHEAVSQALDEALAQWTVFARTAEASARREQRATTLDLLHAARRVALGLETVARLEAERASTERTLSTAIAAATDAVERMSRRLHTVEQLLEAAERTAAITTGADLALVRRTVAVRERATSDHDRLRTALTATKETARRLHDAAARHAAAGVALDELRNRFVALRVDAEGALATVTAAGASLEDSVGLYEQAQLGVVDVRRDVLPPPTGVPLLPPTSNHPIPLAAA